MHKRETIEQLQIAHANYIESCYRQQLSITGNPFEIEILEIGKTRVFLCNEDRLENRAILTGNETEDELREITNLFSHRKVKGFIELNPTNFYRTEPFSWKSEVLPILLKLGCHPCDFRCVWVLDSINCLADGNDQSPNLRRFRDGEAQEFVAQKFLVERTWGGESEKEIERRKYTKSWINYIGYEEEIPVSTSSVYLNDDIGYLAWGYTQENFRRRGHHRAHSLRRVMDAFENGCTKAFSVTDFNIPSSLSLQNIGFKLAYNYILMEKRFQPAAGGNATR